MRKYFQAPFNLRSKSCRKGLVTVTVTPYRPSWMFLTDRTFELCYRENSPNHTDSFLNAATGRVHGWESAGAGVAPHTRGQWCLWLCIVGGGDNPGGDMSWARPWCCHPCYRHPIGHVTCHLSCSHHHHNNTTLQPPKLDNLIKYTV